MHEREAPPLEGENFTKTAR